MIRSALAFALVGATLAAAAAAKPAPRDPLIGPWSFKTAAYGPECVLVGDMEIKAGPTPQSYVCTFQARETCRPWTAQARQTCSVSRTAAGDIVITSRISAADSVTYRPDDFKVRMNGGDEMRGSMSSVYEAPVVFSRKVALTS